MSTEKTGSCALTLLSAARRHPDELVVVCPLYAARRLTSCSWAGRPRANTTAPSCGQHPQGGVRSKRQPSVAALVVGEPSEDAGLDRTAAAAMRHARRGSGR